MDWSAFSRECVAIMAARTRALFEDIGVTASSPVDVDLDTATLILNGSFFRATVAGTVCGDRFTWSWADDTVPVIAKELVDDVREHGRENGLQILSEPVVDGGMARAQQCVAILGRLLDADATWVHPQGACALVIALHRYEMAVH